MAHHKGEGIVRDAATQLHNSVVGAYRALTEGVRKGATKRFADFLASEGSQPLQRLQVARQPVLKGVQFALNVVSFGAFERAKRDLKYDDLWHNLLLATMTDGTVWTLEKNHVVEHRRATSTDLATERGDIPIAPGTTLASLIERASASDPQRFWQYDPSTDNCQRFTIQVAQATGLPISDPYAQQLLQQQDGEALINSLGNLKHLPRQVTDLAASLDRVRYGDSVGVFHRHGRGQVAVAQQILRNYRAGF